MAKAIQVYQVRLAGQNRTDQKLVNKRIVIGLNNSIKAGKSDICGEIWQCHFFVRSVFVVSIISTTDVFLAIAKGLLALWPLLLLIGLIFILKFIYIMWEKQRLLKSGITEIDRMDGLTFEKYLEAFFEKLGYKVERTKYIGDYGADLITCKDGVKTVIQAKRYKRKVDIKAIQEAVAAKGKYGCSEAMAVTNSYFTKPAIELAEVNKVHLWDRDKLVKELLALKKQGSTLEQQLESAAAREQLATTPVENEVCIICGKPVSEKVKQYCLSNPKRFGGRIYCFDHQKQKR